MIQIPAFFTTAGVNASEQSPAPFYLVLQKLPQRSDITVSLLTILPATESSVTALECAHHFV